MGCVCINHASGIIIQTSYKSILLVKVRKYYVLIAKTLHFCNTHTLIGFVSWSDFLCARVSDFYIVLSVDYRCLLGDFGNLILFVVATEAKYLLVLTMSYTVLGTCVYWIWHAMFTSELYHISKDTNHM